MLTKTRLRALTADERCTEIARLLADAIIAYAGRGGFSGDSSESPLEIADDSLDSSAKPLLSVNSRTHSESAVTQRGVKNEA